MKLLNLFVFFFLFSPLHLCAQKKDISGHYVHSDYPESIDIEGSNFIYKKNQSHYPIYDNDTLANCTWKWVDKDLILIRSESPWLTAVSNMKVDQHFNSNSQGCLTITFHIPHDKSPLTIIINDDKCKSHEYKWESNKPSIKLSRDIKKFSLLIRPEYLIDEGYGQFYGIVCFEYGDEEVEDGMNVIDIHIPELNNSFFEKYYIVDEFVRVKNNRIYWKGKVYKKE